MPDDSTGITAAAAGQFKTTHWSAVVRAGHGQPREAALALNELCQLYWYPLYAYARQQVGGALEAEDLTQAFFARLLECNFVAKADPDKGRFRTFLLIVFKRFLVNEWNRQHTQKRGGFQSAINMDPDLAESRLAAESIQSDSPDRLYDRQWALQLLDQVMNRLRREYIESSRTRLFERLEGCLIQEDTARSYADMTTKSHRSRNQNGHAPLADSLSQDPTRRNRQNRSLARRGRGGTTGFICRFSALTRVTFSRII